MPLIGLTQNIPAPKPAVVSSSGFVRGRPILQDNTVMTAERTRMRGVTMALDGPGSLASVYTTNRNNWQKYRDLKFNLVRVPFSVEYENNTLNSMLPDLDAVVANASATGMYAMLMLDGAYGVANYDEFNRVWPTVAARYKNNSNVFYEMNNEPHWLCDHFNSAEYDRVVSIYNLMRTAAPNTLIGMLTPASLDSGAQSVINAINELKNRGVTFGPAFFSFHAYGVYQDTQIQGVMGAGIPSLMTETVSSGPANHNPPDNEVYKVTRMEALKVSWCVLQARFGEVSNVDTPYSNDESSLTQRILPDLTAAGVTWAQDTITSASRALPAGSLFTNRVILGAGVPLIALPGAVTGRVFPIATNFARGTAVGVIGTATLPHSITLNPANPGSLQQASAGAVVNWSTTITATNITAGVTWAVITAAGTQRGNATIIPNTNSNYNITVPFVANGDKLRVWETGNTAINKDSGAVTLVAPTRSITLSPQNPGEVPYQFAAVATTITTKGITNFTFVVVNADGSWTSSGYQRPVNPAGDAQTIDMIYGYNGQYVYVFDTNDPSFNVKGGAATIHVDTPQTNVGFYEGFNNNTTGQLTHVWGNRNQLTVTNGILRLQGIAGLDPWANACGVMIQPTGKNAGYGYGLYEMRVRMSDFIGDGSGAAALTWPADDVWPGGEEDIGEISRDGVFYMAHHWKGPNDANGDPTDAFRTFSKTPHDPTQWHVNAVDIYRDYIEFLVDGVVIGSSRESVTPAFVDGGVNRVPGIMNRSSNTWIECDWVRITPHGATGYAPGNGPLLYGAFAGHSAAEVNQLNTWLGRPIDTLQVFTGGSTWNDVAPTFQLGNPDTAYGTGFKKLNWSIPLTPDGTGTELADMRAAAAGTHDSKYTAWATAIFNSRSGDADPIFVRTAWELGGEWFSWTIVAQTDAAAFIGAFRRFANCFHAVSSRFKIVFDFVPDRGPQEQFYPGDAYVDVISQDVYWKPEFFGTNPTTAFNTFRTMERGLNWVADFANQHKKRIAVAEWGVPGDDTSTVDGSTFINLFKSWMVTNKVAYSNFWNFPDNGYDGRLSDGLPVATANTMKTLLLTNGA